MTAHNLALHFEDVAAASPDAIALICEGESLTFS